MQNKGLRRMNMNLAIVVDWLYTMGGAEKVILNFHQIFPDAPIYTSIYNSDKLDKELQNIDVRTSFLQNKRHAKTNHQRYFPFMPAAFESFDLNNYDVILSSSSSCAKGIITRPDSTHICYCHSPMRYGWEFYYEYANDKKMNQIKKNLLKYFMNYMRIWDNVSSDRVDYFIANSENVARRIWKHYRRESVVIYPPVKFNYFSLSDIDEGYFLIVSRLVEYKKIELAVRAFNEIGLPLVVIGDGEEKKKLQSIAKSNIKFLGRQPDEVIREYYSKCRAFIFPGEEDFGITPLEAQSCGRPVIAYGRGGALETVIDEKTGLFFHEQTVDELKNAVKKFEKMNFNKEEIREHASLFREELFKEKIRNFVDFACEDNKSRHHWKKY